MAKDRHALMCLMVLGAFSRTGWLSYEGNDCFLS